LEDEGEEGVLLVQAIFDLFSLLSSCHKTVELIKFFNLEQEGLQQTVVLFKVVFKQLKNIKSR